MSNFTAISTTTQIKVGAGKLRTIFVSGATSTPTITVYDSDKSSASDPTMVAVFTPSVSTAYHFAMGDGIYFNKGCYIVISGTVTATVAYE